LSALYFFTSHVFDLLQIALEQYDVNKVANHTKHTLTE